MRAAPQLHGRSDMIEGVSESIIMGQPMPVGTGAFQLVHDPTQCKRLAPPTPATKSLLLAPNPAAKRLKMV